MTTIKQVAAGRRKPQMTRKEYFDHRFQTHGCLTDGTEDEKQKPYKYIQTQVFDSAFGPRQDGPFNANQHWFGTDDTTELYFRDWDHVASCFSSEYVKTTIAPDGALFADFETTISLMAREKSVPLQTTAAKGAPSVDAGNSTVAMYFISTPDNAKDGSALDAVATPLLTQALHEHCQNDATGLICNVGAVSDKFDLSAYFGGGDMPQYALVYKVFLKDAASVSAFRKAQKMFEEVAGGKEMINLHTSFVLFSQEALVLNMDTNTRFASERQPVFRDLPGPSHLA